MKVRKNHKTSNSRKALPDVSQAARKNQYSPLNRVGMSGIETMIRITEGQESNEGQGKEISLTSRADISVDLIDSQVRGIHMSRMYRILFDGLSSNRLTPGLLHKILKRCIASQQGISSRCYLRLEFTLPLLRPSLLSGYHGIRHYPVVWEGEYTVSPQERFTFSHNFKILYSSTCPCSTALSEDLQRKANTFTKFSATPHAQRSEADITLRYHRLPRAGFIAAAIRRLEDTIKTPVQTVVKREDEQEFARLNAENQMFCEDAARLIKDSLERDLRVSDYRLRVAHLESLHAHDAVAVAVKGIPGGLTV